MSVSRSLHHGTTCEPYRGAAVMLFRGATVGTASRNPNVTGRRRNVERLVALLDRDASPEG